MVALPKSPGGPTVFVVTEGTPAAETALVAAGLAALAAPRAVEGIAAGASFPAADRRRFLDFLLDEYNACAVLLAAHGGAFYEPDRSDFETRDEACTLVGEVGVIQRAPGALRAAAPRLDAAVRSADATLPAALPEALILGAGPDAAAMAAALAGGRCAAKPEKVTVASVDAKGLTELRTRLAGTPAGPRIETRHVDRPAEHDRLLALLPPGSAVVAALGPSPRAGLSPVGGGALFPEDGLIWDLHAAAGGSALLSEAARQRKTANLTLRNGSAYRLESWVEAIAALAEAEPDDKRRAKLAERVAAALEG